MLHGTYEACFMHEAETLHMKHASCGHTSYLKHASYLYEACFIGVICFTFASYMKHDRLLVSVYFFAIPSDQIAQIISKYEYEYGGRGVGGSSYGGRGKEGNNVKQN